MGLAYKAVTMNRQKWRYDLVAGSVIGVYILGFFVAGSLLYPTVALETLLIRSFSTAAFALLHIILSIGPLARLDSRFLPLLYNRRHLGVMMFVLASVHVAITVIQFHSFGSLHPLVSILIGDGSFERLTDFPFQVFGLLAYSILMLMAFTSHDFWLSFLSAPVWKALHMMVYLAYGLLAAHVLFGVAQESSSWAPVFLVAAGSTWLITIHWLASRRSKKSPNADVSDGFILIGPLDDIESGRAQGIEINGEQVAVFRNETEVWAVSGVCQHQNGPLAEGRLIDGLITCPWHGYQYCPRSGRSPEPFSEIVPTFETRIQDGLVYVADQPKSPSPTSSPC